MLLLNALIADGNKFGNDAKKREQMEKVIG